MRENYGHVVIVSDETGLGIVPDDAMARQFRDHIGVQPAGRRDSKSCRSCRNQSATHYQDDGLSVRQNDERKPISKRVYAHGSRCRCH